MANLKLTGVEKTYAGAVNVLNDIDLDIKQGELIVFVGPSGCGKSTCIQLVQRLYDPDSGEVFFLSQQSTALDYQQMFRWFLMGTT